MKRKSLSNRRKTGKGRIAAVLALAVLLGAAPAVKTRAVDLETGPFTVTVNAPKDAEGVDKFAELLNANVVLDFYQVATADPISGQDAYTFSVTEDFKAVSANLADVQTKSEDGTLQAMDVDKLTQAIAKIKLDGVAEYSPTAPKQTPTEGNKLNTKISVDSQGPGLFLIIPHGSDLTAYKHTITNDDGTTTLTTVANASSMQYVFMPMLVSVPTRGMQAYEEEGSFDTEKGTYTYPIFSGNTANNNDPWVNDIVLDIKVGEQDLDTKIRLDKELLAYETFKDRGDTATFAFSIDAFKDGQNVFSDARSIVLSAADKSDYVEIEGIPIGSSVTVTEAYPGGDYEFVSVEAPKAADATTEGRSITFTATAAPEENDIVLVSFKNKYGDRFNGGGSVTNHIQNNDGSVEGDRTYSNGTSKDVLGDDITDKPYEGGK